jgi:hypothetical protein
MPRRKLLSATYDWNTGELGFVLFSAEFEAESALMQADVLLDLKGVIDARYEEQRKEATRNLSAEAAEALGHPFPPDWVQ